MLAGESVRAREQAKYYYIIVLCDMHAGRRIDRRSATARNVPIRIHRHRGLQNKTRKRKKRKGGKNGSPRLDVCANGRIISNTFGGDGAVAWWQRRGQDVRESKFGFSVLSPAEQHCSSLFASGTDVLQRPGIGAGLRARRGTTAGAAAGLYAGNIFRYGRLTFTRTALAPAHEPTTLFQTYL